jgi:hypothetical protein
MICNSGTRFKVKKGSQATLRVTFDVSELPTDGLSEVKIEWFVKRSLTQSAYDIYKTSDYIDQIEIIDANLGTVDLKLVQENTINLQSGDYYWAFKLTSSALGILSISPTNSHGDFILLDSAVY